MIYRYKPFNLDPLNSVANAQTCLLDLVVSDLKAEIKRNDDLTK